MKVTGYSGVVTGIYMTQCTRSPHTQGLDTGTMFVNLTLHTHAVAAPGGFLGFLETGHPSHQARRVTSNAIRGRRDHG